MTPDGTINIYQAKVAALMLMVSYLESLDETLWKSDMSESNKRMMLKAVHDQLEQVRNNLRFAERHI